MTIVPGFATMSPASKAPVVFLQEAQMAWVVPWRMDAPQAPRVAAVQDSSSRSSRSIANDDCPTVADAQISASYGDRSASARRRMIPVGMRQHDGLNPAAELDQVIDLPRQMLQLRFVSCPGSITTRASSPTIRQFV